MADPIPAATLLLARPAAPGFELLMIERGGGLAFAAGALAFPGGRVDPGDRVLAAATGAGEEAAARVAAIRETIEETGIAVGLAPAPDDAARIALRRRLAGGGDFAAALDAAGASLRLDALAPFARWCPPPGGRRTFDTRFYLAAAPTGAEPLADGGETSEALWLTPAAAVAAAARQTRRIIFPTLRVLERLARFEALEEAIADAAGRDHERVITPRIERREGEDWLCLPEDAGYPVTAVRLAEVDRG